jgi:hypothetical protein
MPNRIQSVLVATFVALVFAAAPVSAVTISDSSGTSVSQKTLAKAERRAAKQARKLAKQCAKLGTKKMKAAKQARLQALCAKPGSNIANAEDQSGPGAVSGDDRPNANDEDVDNGGPGGSVGDVDDEIEAVDNGEDWNDEGDLVDVTDPADAGDDDPDDLLAEILDSPPLFTPPPGGSTQDDSPQTTQRAYVNPEEGDDETPSDVPEPGSLALLSVGLLGLALLNRRRRTAR